MGNSEIRHERIVRYLFSAGVCVATFSMIYTDKLDGWPGVFLIMTTMMVAIGAEVSRFGKKGVELDYPEKGDSDEQKSQ